MTRIAAGHPGIWPDICAENRDAICAVLDDLIAELGAVRATVADRRLGPSLVGRLESAREATAQPADDGRAAPTSSSSSAFESPTSRDSSPP